MILFRYQIETTQIGEHHFNNGNIMSKKTTQEIKEEFGVLLSNEYAIPLEHMHDFVKTCSDNEIGILGFDGIKIGVGAHEVLIDWIADFSSLREENLDWDQFQHQSIAASLHFIKHVDVTDIYFIPTLVTEGEYTTGVK